MSRRSPSPFAIVALVILLAAVVAVASHGTPIWTLLRDGYANRLEVLAGVAALWAGGSALAVGIAVAAHRLSRAGGQGATPLSTTLGRAVPVTVAALTVVSLLAISRADLGRAPAAEERPGHVPEESDRRARPLVIDWWGSPVRAGDGTREGASLQEDGSDSGVDLPLGFILAGVIALALAGAIAWRRRGDRTEDQDEDNSEVHRQAMHGTFVGTIDAMLADPDPNTAIRGAYARVLEGLAACGAARHDHEGPMEHLRRVLGVLDVGPAPLRELIELFAVARFSTHPLDASHRDRALAALRAVASDLEATPAVARS